MGVRLLRQYTPSGRALTAALGRVGHRARRNSCLSAGRLGQAVVEVAVAAHFVPWLECPHFATAGSHDRDGASWRRRASWSEPSPGRHRIRADTDTRRGRADPSLPAVATERLTSSFGHPHGSASGRRAAARASPTAPLRVQRQWSVGARTSNRSTPIGPRRVPGDERVLPVIALASPHQAFAAETVSPASVLSLAAGSWRHHAVGSSGGRSRTRGRYSTSWMRPSKVRLSIISRATSG